MSEKYHSITNYLVNFKKSLCDLKKSYMLIRLKNGLLSLLVSDPYSDFSSASLCVSTGSHHDPEGIQGLAHLCEHMLFMGSKEFPNPSIFFHIIESNGGETNAYTTGEQTNFYFEVKNATTVNEHGSSFEKALDIFASFFISPLFSDSSISDEVSTVDEEHSSNVTNTSKIFYHALRLLANKKHPFQKFGTGNYSSLKKEPKLRGWNLKKALIEFFYTHYIANKMTLVIKGPQSLNHLQKLAYSYFNRIRLPHFMDCEFSIVERSFQQRYFKEPIYRTEELGKLLIIQNDTNLLLRITFPVQFLNEISDFDFFSNMWCNVIGDENKGTFCDFAIRTERLASSIYVHKQSLTYNCSVLNIDITLLKRGEKKVDVLIESLFKYISHIVFDSDFDSILQLLNYFATIDRLNYYYKKAYNSASLETSAIAENMQRNLLTLLPINILKGYRNLGDDDKYYKGDLCHETKVWWMEKTQEFLKLSRSILSWKNFNLIIINPNPLVFRNLVTRAGILIEEPYFSFKYSVSDLDVGSFQKPLSKKTKFELPGISKFLKFTQIGLDIMTETLSKGDFGFPTGICHSESPCLVDFSPRHEVWHKNVAHDAFDFQISTSFLIQFFDNNSVDIHVGLELISIYIGTTLKQSFYLEELIGFSWAIYPARNGSPGLTFNFSGIRSCYETAFESFLKEIKSLLMDVKNWTNRNFMDARVTLRKEYELLQKESGITKSIIGLTNVLEENSWSLIEILEALELLELKDLSKIGYSLLRENNYTKILAHGNHELYSVLKSIGEFTGYRNISTMPITCMWASSYLLHKGINYLIEENNMQDNMDTVHYYVQLGCREDSFVRTLGKLISYWLSIRSEIVLRTQKHIAYSIQSGLRLNRSTVGIYIIILTANVDLEDITRHIESLFLRWEEDLKKLQSNDFQEDVVVPFLNGYNDKTVKTDTINLLFSAEPLSKSSNFAVDSQHNTHQSDWEKIVNNIYRFSGPVGEDEIDISLLKSLTLSSFLTFFHQRLSFISSLRTSLTIVIPKRKLSNLIINTGAQTHSSKSFSSFEKRSKTESHMRLKISSVKEIGKQFGLRRQKPTSEKLNSYKKSQWGKDFLEPTTHKPSSNIKVWDLERIRRYSSFTNSTIDHSLYNKLCDISSEESLLS
ncbi:uncharacterized protein PRCAT00002007001 [Priceomyces carsonii]|uniref:uncharacterized protein n=1 Tax=Priceomyces carsonii TaxID=28549 RepID=UPI002ED7D8D7|nr:unnamed protein product [Priceomyces carsonii]